MPSADMFVVTLGPEGRICLPPDTLREMRWATGMELLVFRDDDQLVVRVGPVEGERKELLVRDANLMRLARLSLPPG